MNCCSSLFHVTKPSVPNGNQIGNEPRQENVSIERRIENNVSMLEGALKHMHKTTSRTNFPSKILDLIKTDDFEKFRSNGGTIVGNWDGSSHNLIVPMMLAGKLTISENGKRDFNEYMEESIAASETGGTRIGEPLNKEANRRLGNMEKHVAFHDDENSRHCVTLVDRRDASVRNLEEKNPLETTHGFKKRVENLGGVKLVSGSDESLHQADLNRKKSTAQSDANKNSSNPGIMILPHETEEQKNRASKLQEFRKSTSKISNPSLMSEKYFDKKLDIKDKDRMCRPIDPRGGRKDASINISANGEMLNPIRPRQVDTNASHSPLKINRAMSGDGQEPLKPPELSKDVESISSVDMVFDSALDGPHDTAKFEKPSAESQANLSDNLHQVKEVKDLTMPIVRKRPPRSSEIDNSEQGKNLPGAAYLGTKSMTFPGEIATTEQIDEALISANPTHVENLCKSIDIGLSRGEIDEEKAVRLLNAFNADGVSGLQRAVGAGRLGQTNPTVQKFIDSVNDMRGLSEASKAEVTHLSILDQAHLWLQRNWPF